MSDPTHLTEHHLFWIKRWYTDTELGREFRDLTTVMIPDVVHRLIHDCFEYDEETDSFRVRVATDEEMKKVVRILRQKRRPRFSG